jgi:hypothetical protein
MKALVDLAAALPELSRYGLPTIREACLTYREDGTWEVLAGGHSHVSLGEWGGDYQGHGSTAEEALAACLKAIERSKP